MPDYSDQWTKEGAKRPNKEARAEKEPTHPTSEITTAEWMIVGFIAIVADLLGPAGFLLIPILLLWYGMKFHKFPTKKIIGASLFEIVSLGFLPGWSGFVLVIYAEQKGYMPKWLSKLTKGKI